MGFVEGDVAIHQGVHVDCDAVADPARAQVVYVIYPLHRQYRVEYFLFSGFGQRAFE